jgi:hypothetical protein
MIESGGPLLALVALVAIAWARRQDNQVRRKARHLQWRIKANLDGFQFKAHRVRQRAAMIADVYARGNHAKKKELTQGTDELISQMHRVAAEFDQIAAQLSQARRSALRAGHLRLQILARDLQSLASDLDELDSLWSKELAGMSGAKPSISGGLSGRGITTV